MNEAADSIPGMFLYAKLMMGNLQNQVNKSDVLREVGLRELPKEIDDVYVFLRPRPVVR